MNSCRLVEQLGFVVLIVLVICLFALPSSAAPSSLHTSVTVQMYALNRSGSRTEIICTTYNTLYGCTAFEGSLTYSYPYETNPAVVPIETDYLLDVVAQEMSPEVYGATAALQAQAIASRSLVNYYVNNPPQSGNPPDDPFNNSSKYQVFIPYRYDRLNATAQQQVSAAVAPQHYIASVVPAGNDLPAKALFAADIYAQTDNAIDDKPYFVGVADPISTACDADNEAVNRYGMSQQGANRWARGHECSQQNAQVVLGNSRGARWSVRWERPEQILFHYYTGVHLRDAGNASAILSPPDRWNPLKIRGVPWVIDLDAPLAIVVQVQNTGVQTWMCSTAPGEQDYYTLHAKLEPLRQTTRTETGDVATDRGNVCGLGPGQDLTTTVTIDNLAAIPRDGGMYRLVFDVFYDTDYGGPYYWFSGQGALNWPAYEMVVCVERCAWAFLPLISLDSGYGLGK